MGGCGWRTITPTVEVGDERGHRVGSLGQVYSGGKEGIVTLPTFFPPFPSPSHFSRFSQHLSFPTSPSPPPPSLLCLSHHSLSLSSPIPSLLPYPVPNHFVSPLPHRPFFLSTSTPPSILPCTHIFFPFLHSQPPLLSPPWPRLHHLPSSAGEPLPLPLAYSSLSHSLTGFMDPVRAGRVY